MRKHSTTILTLLGSAGVVATSVLAVKATPKALNNIQEAKNEKGDELTVQETIKVAWKPYVPAAISGVATIACIFGIKYLSVKSQASLMSAYALLNNTFDEYRKKTKELCGDDIYSKINHDIIKAKIVDQELDGVQTIFYDYQSGRCFESSMENVMNAEHELLENLYNRGYACLNEFYDLLGIPKVDYGYQLGWFSVENNDPYNCRELDFTNDRIMIDDKIECHIINPTIPASCDYIL